MGIGREEVFLRRPFKVRNADEYRLENVLNLFVSPTEGLQSPFDFENTIIKGRMGSGKTMYLRANHAFHLYGLVPCLLNREELILPIMIKLSDFQHLKSPSDIYSAVIIKIVEEIVGVYEHLCDASKLAELHAGARYLPLAAFNSHNVGRVMQELSRLSSEEYVSRVGSQLGVGGGFQHPFVRASLEYREDIVNEIKGKPNPGFQDVEKCYKTLLQDQSGQLLILIDEAGSLDKSFFQSGKEQSIFEILMNQLRTSSFVRTKVAVYPNSYSDLLTETRYGDLIRLEDVVGDQRGYLRFRNKVVGLIDNYLNPDSHEPEVFSHKDFFDVSGESEYGDCLEQIIYASSGNMRRLIQLLDTAMSVAYADSGSEKKVSKHHTLEALKRHAESIESLFTSQERDFLNQLVTACKARVAFKFVFPHKSPVLYKYTNKSDEANVIRVEELGAGRKGTVYAFDYAYCVLKDVPTHYLEKSEKVNRDRSVEGGRWIGRAAQINEEVMQHATLPGKVEGVVSFIFDDGGFVNSEGGGECYFTKSDIIESDIDKHLYVGKHVRYYPIKLEGSDTAVAVAIEVL